MWLDFTPPVIALRGNSLDHAPNTMPAFEAAAAAGVEWIATEIKLSCDGTPILFQDEAVDATTNGSGSVADLNWSDLDKLNVGKNPKPDFVPGKICKLTEFLDFVRLKRLRMILDLKPSPGRTRATAIVVLIEAAKSWPEECPVPVIASEDEEALRLASQLHPGWPRGIILKEWRDDWRELATSTQATMLHIKADLLTPERIQVFRQTHMPILAFPVDDADQAKKLLQHGVSAVFTERPGELLRHL